MPKSLSVGSKAPNFSLTDVCGQKANLSSDKDKYVLIVFLRYAGCPWCNLAIHRLVFEQRLLTESNCKIIAFVQSNKENILKNIYQRHEMEPGFSVVADQKLSVYRKYGVVPSLRKSISLIKDVPHWVHAVRKKGFKNENIDGNLFIAPAVFLLSPNDRDVLYTEYPANLFENNTFSKVYDAIFLHNAS